MKPTIDPIHLRQIDGSLRFQASQYVQFLRKAPLAPGPLITISREYGCEGYGLASALTEKLTTKDHPWLVYSRDMHDSVSSKGDPIHELNEIVNAGSRDMIQEMFDQYMADKPTDIQRYRTLVENVSVLSKHGYAVILGGGAGILTQTNPRALHVRLLASEEFRVKRIATVRKLSEEDAHRHVNEHNENRVAFIQKFTRKDVNDPYLYDVMLNNGTLTVDQMSDIIIQTMNVRHLL